MDILDRSHRKKPGPPVDQAVVDFGVDLMTDHNLSAEQAHAQLVRLCARSAQESPIGGLKPVSYKTLAREAKRRARLPPPPRDDSGAWSLGSDTTGAPQSVLAALAGIVTATGGRVSGLTRAEADVIARLQLVASGLPAEDLHILARLYVSRRVRGLGSEDLDLYVAFAPWNGPDDRRTYLQKIEDGLVPRPPRWFTHPSLRAFAGEKPTFDVVRWDRSEHAINLEAGHEIQANRPVSNPVSSAD
jgi:hypothetical protein